MIWNSIPLMTTIDIVIILASIVTLAIFHYYLDMIKSLKLTMGISPIVMALMINALFHSYDLLVMHRIPIITSSDNSMSIMADLHLNWSWLKTLISVGSITIGLSYLLHSLIPKTVTALETLQQTERALRESNDKLEKQIDARLSELQSINAQLQHEINERKVIEDELIASKSRWQSLLENAPNILFEFDRDGIIQFINYVTVDADVNDVIGTSLYNFALPEEHQRVKGYIEKVFETGEPLSYETMGLDEHWYAVRIGAIKQNGHINSLMMVLTDITDLKKSELSLRESEARLLQAMKIARLGIWDWDIETGKAEWYGEIFNTYGVSPEEFTGNGADYLGFIRDDYQAKYDDVTKAFGKGVTEAQLQSGIELEYNPQELCIVRPDGTEAYTMGDALTIVNDEGNTVRMIGVIVDITESKKTISALEESEARFQNYMENLPGAVFLKDEAGRLLYCNDFYANMIGHKPEDIIGKTSLEIMPPSELRDSFIKENQQVLEQETAQIFESIFPSPDGNTYWETVKFPIKLSDNSLHLGAISLEITKRKQSEEAIKRSETRLRSIAQALPDVTFIFDRDTTIIDILTSREELLSAPIEVLKGRSIRDSQNLKQAQIQQLLAIVHKTFETGESHAIEYEHDVQAGHRWFDARTALLSPIENEDERILCVVRDITERKQAEIKLSQSKELIALKDRIISTVSHEFRTPLAVIQTSSDLLIRYSNKLTPTRKTELFEQIQEQVISLDGLIDDMLSINRAQSKQIDFNPSKIDLEAFCRTIFDQVQFVDTSNHQFEFLSNLSHKQLMLDGRLLEHAIQNLLTNAVKYSPPNSPITLKLDNNDTNIFIRIIDKGIGIPPENLGQLFEPFFRAGNVTNIAGTGMGLAIVKEYIELHGGTIVVESQVNEGSTFTISLPLN